MAMDHARVAKDVLTYVGGADNINAAAHCATRLRLVLNDMDKVDQKALDKDPDLKGTFIAGGMFQIIVGPGDVDLVFSEMIRTGGVKEVSKDEAKEQAAKGGNPLSRFIKTIADIFVPILPALIAGGLMMALNNVLTAQGLFGDQALTERWGWLKDYAALINMISASAFAFLPVLVGYSATKRFGGNVYLGAAMGAAMVSTSLLSAYSMSDPEAAAKFWEYTGESSTWSLFGLEVAKIGYQAMVIPVLCVAWILSVVEKWLHKRLSGTADFLLTPLFTMLVTGFLTFIVVGPLTRELSIWITDGLDWLYNTAGPVGGFLFGIVYSPIVVTGLHQSFPAVELPLIADKASTGGSFIFPIASMANVAQGAVALAVFLKTRDAKMKGLAGAGGVSALFGITEPAIFGVNLRLRWPFFIGMGAAGIGGILVSLLDLRTHSLGAAGMVGFVSMRTTDIPKYLAVEVFTIIIAFAAAYAYASTRGKASLAGDDVDVDEAALEAEAMAEHAETVELPAEAAEDFSVTAPIQGRAIPLSEVEDQTFASGMLGPGMAIAPRRGRSSPRSTVRSSWPSRPVTPTVCDPPAESSCSSTSAWTPSSSRASTSAPRLRQATRFCEVCRWWTSTGPPSEPPDTRPSPRSSSPTPRATKESRSTVLERFTGAMRSSTSCARPTTPVPTQRMLRPTPCRPRPDPAKDRP